MARARNIKPGFFTNDELGELSPLARLAFIGLWSQADFNGNMKCKPKRLKVEILPYDNVDFADLISELEAAGFILVYTVKNERFLHVVNFRKHQRPHKNEVLRGTDIPEPVTEQEVNETDEEQERNDTEQGRDENRSNPPDTGYRIPDTKQNKGPSDDEPAIEDSLPAKLTAKEFEDFWSACRDNWIGNVGTKKEAKAAFVKLNRAEHDPSEITRLTVLECQTRKRARAAGQFVENMKHVCRWIRYAGWEGVADRPRSTVPNQGESKKFDINQMYRDLGLSAGERAS